MKKIAVFTGTRAEYGLLSLILKGLKVSEKVELQLFVGGTHLSQDFGYTINHIIDDGFDITERLDFLLASDRPLAVSKSMALAQIAAAECFERHQPDMLVLLGDRFEALAVAQAAVVAGLPIAHIHGGELTEAAMDDAFRHAITKLSHWHFTATEVYRQRVIQLGEPPENVFNFGAPGIDNIKKLPLLSLDKVSEVLNIELSKPYMLVTYHPETLSDLPVEQGMRALLNAIDRFPSYQVLVTYPNADADGRIIMAELEAYAQRNQGRVFLFRSIGQLNYLSAMRHASLVIGNSSSGIIETPSFNIPTVNIGDRQKGRISSDSVIDVKRDEQAIVEGIDKALSDDFLNKIKALPNPYGDGHACEKIVKQLIEQPFPNKIKRFYDLRIHQGET
ncbi:UDP-N-acetylglucosamine 2-epimerase [Thalassotalea ganghwensis]